MSNDNTYRRTTKTTTRSNRRPLYAPPPPPPGSGFHRQHSLLGYWVPLITIGTIAVGGLAAWIWSERSEHDGDDYYPPDNKPQRPPTGTGGPYPPQGPQPSNGGQYPQGGPPGGMPPPVGSQQQQQQPSYQPPQGPPPPGGHSSSYYNVTETQTSTSETRQMQQQEDGTFLGRVSGVMRRAPSPQQFFDSASRQVTAGMAAAGAAAGAALSSIMEEDRHGQAYGEAHGEKEGFSDHERWSEEADELRRVNMTETDSTQRVENTRAARDGKGKPKRSVAVVVTADIEPHETDDDAYHTEHGSILSHLPAQHDPAQTDLFVLIYAPSLKSLPPANYQPGKALSTISSFSHISTPAVTPGSELQSISPRIDAIEPSAKHFEVLYNQALSLVSHPTQILPFTTQDGYVHMLRHLSPQLVYISDTLSGREGEGVAQLKGWVGHTIVVVGDDGHGGLADTETETEDERSGGEKTVKWRWYENSPLVGLGKEIEVVDAARVGDDWSRRVFNKE